MPQPLRCASEHSFSVNVVLCRYCESEVTVLSAEAVSCHPQAWIARDLIQAYSRTRGADAAFEAAAELRRQGLQPDGIVYYALLQACAQVSGGDVTPCMASCVMGYCRRAFRSGSATTRPSEVR